MELGNQSIKKGFRPDDPSEYLPFIEAYNHVYRYDDANELTKTAYQKSMALRPALCATWHRAASGLSGSTSGWLDGEYARAVQQLGCPTP